MLKPVQAQARSVNFAQCLVLCIAHFTRHSMTPYLSIPTHQALQQPTPQTLPYELHHTVLYCTLLYSTFLTELYCTVLYCTSLYCSCTVPILHFTLLYYTLLYCTALYSTALHCTPLYCQQSKPTTGIINATEYSG